MSLLTSIFGDANKRFIKLLADKVKSVGDFESSLIPLSDEQLKSKTSSLKLRIAQDFEKIATNLKDLDARIRQTMGEEDKNLLKKEYIRLANQPLDQVLPEAFALVREAAKRTLGQRHFDVQIMGGMVMHDGQVAEMKTGEGKTLTSTLSIYLNALVGRGVHVVTVNDYLARRDAIWMGQIFNFLNLSVGVIVHDSAYVYDPTATTSTEDAIRDQGIKVDMEYLRSVDRKTSYAADITYGTNNEFGFDYLRDNMVLALDEKVQRDLHYAIIDEVDSILIDEARTPLIISAPDSKSTDQYYQFAKIVESLTENADYNVDEKLRAATLSEAGVSKIEKILNVENIYVQAGIQTVHHIEQALKAKALYTRDKDYTVKDGQVLIVDEFTGRLLQGRRYSEGLHQAIEAKEDLEIQRESKTMATITFQNYFRLYNKLAGMTGTAETEAEELAKIYNLDVTTIPTNRPMIRKDLSDRIYKTQEGKFKAVVHEIKERNKSGQPVLVGTISIEKNEYLARMLEQEGLSINVLNAKQHEREAEIIAQAGSKHAITIATNMAGRGVDIKLGGVPFENDKFDSVISSGGLHVIGTERHESRRIDNQLRGRGGRQGEPGSTQFYVSLDDDLMRIFGAERVKMLMKSWPDDMPIENGFISKSIESAQKRVEGNNFDIRKHLVEYDDVINKQRMFIYNRRNDLLALTDKNSDQVWAIVENELLDEIDTLIDFHLASEKSSEWNTKEIFESVKSMLSPSKNDMDALEKILSDTAGSMRVKSMTHDLLIDFAKQRYDMICKNLTESLASPDHSNPSAEIIRNLYLRSLDLLWVEHLETINYLRTGIGLRGYGQRDPLVEYKRESKELFNRLLADIRRQFVYSLMNVNVGIPTPLQHNHQHQHVHEEKQSVTAFTGEEKPLGQHVEAKPKDETGNKIGRNDPCFCGSGLKYKKCHGA